MLAFFICPSLFETCGNYYRTETPYCCIIVYSRVSLRDSILTNSLLAPNVTFFISNFPCQNFRWSRGLRRHCVVIGQGYYERQWVLPLFQSMFIYINFFNLPLTKISSKYDDWCLRCDNEPVERIRNYSMLGEWRKIRVLTTYAKLDFAEPADQRIHTYIIWFITPHRRF